MRNLILLLISQQAGCWLTSTVVIHDSKFFLFILTLVAVTLNMNNNEENELGDGGDQLPSLVSIWECPMINRATVTDAGKSVSGWTCGWCPSEDGTPNFLSQ